MTELTIYGRGGQGGVTLAKLIAESYFLRDKHVQAFGVYAAERSGAPLQAYVRIDDEEITNHNQITEPDHVIVLDRTLIGPRVLTGLKPDGWIILNTSESPEAYGEMFPGRRVATIDATAIAVANGLGTRSVPIVNTTVLGAAMRLFERDFTDVEAALAVLKFGGGNVTSAREAYDCVSTSTLPGEAAAAPVMGPAGRATGLLDAGVGLDPLIKTGGWATRQPDRQRLTPPCNDGCPAGNDVQGFVAAVGKQDYTGALEILLSTSPLPATCGRVCPAPCMDACNRSMIDESINIRELERYAAERGTRPEPTKPTRKERVAVVGSGPAGLGAAYHLAKLGYPVELFEACSELGGVMRTGIPAYRLPRDVLDAEIDYILKQGVEAHTGYYFRRRDLLEATKKFSAVFLATGLQEVRSLDLGVVAGGSTDTVLQGIDFLDQVRRNEVSVEGERVIVIGGGNTAMDAAGSARRLGAASVRVVYRRTREQMPAIKEEVEAALEEGIALDELVSPIRLQDSGVTPLLTCQRMKLGEPDESGRARPVPETSEDAFFDIPCDRVILALGQSADLSILPEGSEIRDGEALMGLTEAPVFCGGDFATNDGTVTAALGAGRRAALHVHRTLTDEDLFPPASEPMAGTDVMTTHVFTRSPRQDGGTIAHDLRCHSFTEVHTGYSDNGEVNQAVLEAKRCFSCGVCNTCDRCQTYCPEGILFREGDGYRFDYDYCKGCGVCASVCPRGVIYMSEL